MTGPRIVPWPSVRTTPFIRTDAIAPACHVETDPVTDAAD